MDDFNDFTMGREESGIEGYGEISPEEWIEGFGG